MKVVFTGKGTSGSWKIRGEQLGTAMGATLAPKAREVPKCHVAVIVKRSTPELLASLRSSKAKIVWDVVDSWPQPIGNTWGKAECLSWLSFAFQTMHPSAVVAATRAMAKDLESFGVPVLFLPHHSNPSLEANPIREKVQRVGYQGGERYLGRWLPFMQAECARRGWEFVVNPPTLAELDIVVALRHDSGYAVRNWKSGVKLSNAQGTGTPFIGSPERGYLEQCIGNCERFVETEREVQIALDALTHHKERCRVSNWMSSVAPRLETVAKNYQSWLEGI